MSQPTVLYDVPGPKTRRRHLLWGAVGGLVVLAALGWIIYKLNASEQFEKEKWEPFTKEGIWEHTFIPGIVTTLKTAAVSIVLAVVFGAILCAGRLSDHRIVRMPMVVVIEFFRAVPVVLMLLFLLIAFGDHIGDMWLVVIGLTLYNGAVLSETFRAGIASVPRGQSEAAYSLGLRKGQVMSLVLIPQAVRAMLPAIISQCVVTLKDTSLGYIISYQELVHRSKGLWEFYNNTIPTAIVLATMYIIMNSLLSMLATWLESRQRRRGGATVDRTQIDVGQAVGPAPRV